MVKTRSKSEVRARPQFTFIDLFAGIGGTRMAFERAGGTCVFTCEWDRYAVQTYKANFDVRHPIHGDIATLVPEMVPAHDVLLAGFPCQPFSLAGVVKKNSLGRKHGFEDEHQGKRFDDLANIIQDTKPRAFVLENVKNLLSHDKGNTFQRVRQVLADDGAYLISHRVMDARPFVPQHRERVIIVGFRADVGTVFDFDQIEIPGTRPVMADVLHPENGTERPELPYTEYPDAKVGDRYTITENLWAYFQEYVVRQRERGNGFGYGMVTPEMYSRTLSSRYYKDGAEILVSQGSETTPRRLTPRECARLMGFPDSFQIPVSDTQAYRQFGNSVVVPLIEAVAHQVVMQLNLSLQQQSFDPELPIVDPTALIPNVSELVHA